MVLTVSTPITIRLARADDAADLATLAQLDSAGVPAAPVLVAETAGTLLAALSLLDGVSVADPFRPTAHVVDLLRAHATRAAVDRAHDHQGIPVPLPSRRRARLLASAH